MSRFLGSVFDSDDDIEEVEFAELPSPEEIPSLEKDWAVNLDEGFLKEIL